MFFLVYEILKFIKESVENRRYKKNTKKFDEIKQGAVFDRVNEYIANYIKNNSGDSRNFISHTHLRTVTVGDVKDSGQISDYRYKINTDLLIFQDVITFYGGQFQYIDERKFDDYYVFDQLENGIIHFHKDNSVIYILRAKNFDFYILTQRYIDEGYLYCVFTATNEIAENIDKSLNASNFKLEELKKISYTSLMTSPTNKKLSVEQIIMLHRESEECSIRNGVIYSLIYKFAKNINLDTDQIYSNAAEMRILKLLEMDTENKQSEEEYCAKGDVNLNNPIGYSDESIHYMENAFIYDEIEEFLNESYKNEYKDWTEFHEYLVEEIALDENIGIKELSQQRGIKHLVHFTQLENLESILKYGIVPVSKHGNRNINAKINDISRFDNCTNSTSVSIEFPNYRFFYRLRDSDRSKNWIVLKLKPKILWEKECAFCSDNAARNSVSGLPIEERKGTEAFKMLFSDLKGKPTRKQLGIPDNYATNPQAEILVFNEIETTYIDSVVFSDYELAQKYISKFGDYIKIEYNEQLFKYRQDYQWWSA